MNQHIELRNFTCQLVIFQDAVARHYGLTPSDMAIYNLIVISAQITPKQIVERTGMSTGGTTKILDHLESVGAIIRKPNSGDRRSIVVEATAAPLAVQGEVTTIDFDAVIEDLFNNLEQDEKAVVEKFLRHANKRLLAQTQNVLTSGTTLRETSMTG